MKKLVLAMCVLITALYSCSEGEDGKNLPDGYVDVTIGVESESLESGSGRSIVYPTGSTSWDMYDNVILLDDGEPQEFSYASETAKNTAVFKGKLTSGRGKQLYRAYHPAKNTPLQLLEDLILKVERGADIIIDAEDQEYNSEQFGKHCPMIAIPREFDVDNGEDNKAFQFVHIATMIVASIQLRKEGDADLKKIALDEVVFTVTAKNGSKPFYNTISIDMKKPLKSLEDLDNCIMYDDSDDVKINAMSTTMKFAKDYTLGELIEEYKSHKGFPIPVFTLPTENNFEYIASVVFKFDDVPQLEFQSTGLGEGLVSAGLNILDFDYQNVVPIPE